MGAEAQTQVAYWNRVANTKRFSHPLRLDWLQRELEQASPQPWIVDYGCGYGRTLIELTNAGYENIVGIDFSAGMLARCHVLQPELPLLQTDGQTLPLRDDSVAAVLLFAFFTCIPDSEVQEQQIMEVWRVLRPGGLIYISDLLLNEDERNRARYDKNEGKFGCYGVFELPEGVVVRHHSREWIEELTRSFESLEFEPFDVTTMNGNQSAAFQYLGRKTADLDHRAIS